jgi:hypothetical protein
VFTLALVIRVAVIESTGATRIEFGDGPDYVVTAQAMCVQHVYPERGNLPFFRAPGLPFFIAAVTACEPGRIRIIKYGLAACDALTVLLIFLLAEGNWLAAMLAALHPFFIGSVTDIRGEPLFMLLLVAAIWFVRRGSPALAGVSAGLCALTRPTGLLCIPLCALGAWLIGPPARRRIASAAIALALSLVTLAPWVVRNYVRFHELILVNDAGGFNFWRSTNREILEIVATSDRASFAERALRFEREVVPPVVREVNARASSPAARDREWRRLALENLRADPSFAARSTLKKMAMYWRPWLHPAEHGPKAIALSLVVNLALFAAGAIGLWRSSDRRFAVATVIFFVTMWLAHAPYVPTMRLRIPLTDPLLIVFAASFLRDAYEHHRQPA